MEKSEAGRREVKSHPGLARVSAALIHVPVALPLPAAGRQLEAVQRLGVDAGDVAPRPAVGGQQGVGEAVHRVPPLQGRRGDVSGSLRFSCPIGFLLLDLRFLLLKLCKMFGFFFYDGT